MNLKRKGCKSVNEPNQQISSDNLFLKIFLSIHDKQIVLISTNSLLLMSVIPFVYKKAFITI